MQSFRRICRLILASTLVLLTVFPHIIRPVIAAEGIHEKINFQGKVTLLNGTNVTNGDYDFVFRLYTASSGGVAAWTETWNSGTSQVTVTDGIFQVELGTHQSLSSLDFNSDAWYLTVQFNGDTEMDPRIRMTAVPFAFNAKTVAGLTVQDSSGGADTTGTLKVGDGKTLTFVDDFTTAGAFGLTLTTTATTNVTLPTTGTLATLAGGEIFTNKTIGSTGLTFSGASTDITTAGGEALVLTGNAASTFQTSAGGLTLQAAGSSTISTVQIGAGGAGNSTPDFLGLDVKSDTGDPAGGFEGAMYYNTADNKFRCYQATAWTDCIGSGGPGGGTWDTIGDAAADGAVAMAQYDQNLDWNMASDAALNALEITLTNDVAGSNTQNVLTIADVDDGGSNGATESLLIVDARDTNEAVTNGMLISSVAGAITNGINASDSDIVNALIAGANDLSGTNWSITGASGNLDTQGIIQAGSSNVSITDSNGNLLESAIADGSVYSRLGAAETITGGWTFNTAATIFTTALNANGGLTTSTSNTALTLTANGSGDVVFNTDADTNVQITAGASSGVDLLGVSTNGNNVTTTAVDGMQIDFSNNGASAIDNAGLRINMTSNNNNASTTLQGLTIAGITGQASATEYALVIGSGWDRGLSVASASTFTSTLTSEGVFTIGTGSNTFTFTPGSGPLFAGTARTTRKVTLVPEYEGATLTPDGSSNTGTMTSDFCYDGAGGGSEIPDRNTSICNSGERHNYYYWTSTGANDYDIWVDWQVPDDFSEFATTPAVKFYSRKDAAGDAITLTLYDDTKAICGSATSLSATSTWTNTNYADVSSCDGASGGNIIAGDIVTFRIQMSVAANGNDAYMGEIEVNYLGKY